MNGNNANQTTSNRNMLTDKELNYMKDMMSWELLAMKKCNEAAQGCMDQNIANIIRETGRRHEQHYDAVLNFLQ